MLLTRINRQYIYCECPYKEFRDVAYFVILGQEINTISYLFVVYIKWPRQLSLPFMSFNEEKFVCHFSECICA